MDDWRDDVNDMGGVHHKDLGIKMSSHGVLVS